MAIVTRTGALADSRPWSYSLVDKVDYKQYLDSAQNLHEVNLLVEEAVRNKIISDTDLAKSGIIAKRSADQVSQAIAAVGGMTAGKIAKSIDISADRISGAIGESADRLSTSIDASVDQVAGAGRLTVEAIELASDLNLEALEVLNYGVNGMISKGESERTKSSTVRLNRM